MRTMILFCLFFTLVACDNVHAPQVDLAPTDVAPGGSGEGTNSKPVGSSLTNVTDYSVCGDTTPAGMVISDRPWYLRHANKDVSDQLSIVITNDIATLSRTCRLGQYELTAKITVPVILGSTEEHGVIEFLTSAAKTEELKKPEAKMTCGVSVTPGITNYVFKGRCLLLKALAAKDNMVFVPY